ncbi:Holliday junction resolvase RecU [Agrilactobacillus fermenti]|uniref:Holliday junction resolvase RecU n=1 Tax=Agrilactobacillus fermenti TaxID=2586909 RepID=UPI001E63A121|nr:Holliday junction resolvase RecU [Agrilactobacillus fermenti]MCD2255850.1 Holliday junction resolvase RecU [Agrilactobacillus fermenti]
MIKYPNGQAFEPVAQLKHEQFVKAKQQKVVFGHRGMALEDEINSSNEYYRNHDTAVVYKKPTPVQIVHVDYPKRAKAVIKEAYFRQPSTTDYNGVYQGRYLDFEAKETKNKRSFPLKNFHQHQIDHFKRCLKQQGICFVLVKFVAWERVFLYPATKLITAWEAQQQGGAKSIQLTEFEHHGYEIKYAIHPILPYIQAVEQLLDYLKESN